MVIIQVPFKKLGVVSDVTFSVLKEDIPTLLLTKDMLDYGFIIRIHCRYARLGRSRDPLEIETYFLILR